VSLPPCRFLDGSNRLAFSNVLPPMSAFENTLASRVDQAIQTNPYINGRTLRFETEGSRVVLQGSVKSYFQKQMAQEALRKVEGVEQIDNCLEVLWA
jgi:osmotically-inducible protein OsmY